MKKLLVLVAVFSTQFVWAQPATFVDNVLSIPQAVLIDQTDPVYYSNVQLSDNGNGTLSVTAGEKQNLVAVESADVLIMESFPVQVSVAVSGNKSVPCVELLPAAVARQGSVFTIILAETVLGPAESCIAVLEPFQTNVSLDVLGLSAGTYTVRVNSLETEFTLTMDNGPVN